MGLDMYLYGATITFDEEKCTSTIKLEEVAYWRKQNAIHNWIVQNVQDGVDNCAMYFVNKVYLKRLLTACKEVLKNPTVKNAMELLPTIDGFFFGGTDLTEDYELEYYLHGLKYTVETIEELLNNNKFECYYYQSSW